MTNKEGILKVVITIIGIISGMMLAVSVLNAAHAEDNVTSHSSPKHITPQVKDDDGEEQTDKINREGDKAATNHAKDIEDAGDDKTVAEKDKKNGNDLTVILKLKYSLPGKWYKNVRLDIDELYSKKYDLSKQPSKITVKHLEIAEGHSFKVSLNNYGTDDGESLYMHNSICKCPETRTVKVP